MIKNKIQLLLLLVYFSYPAFANDSPVDVYIIDPNLPAESFQDKGFNIYPVSPETEQDALMPVKLIEDLLYKADLNDATRDWQIIDKDLLIITIRHQSVKYTATKYPELPIKRLHKLKALVGSK